MLKILQARLQQYVNHELPDVQPGFRKGRGTRDQIANIHGIIEKAREYQKNICFCFIDCAKAFDCVYHNKLWKILKEMEIPEHLTYSFSYLEPVCCSMSSSNCCFLTCIQISQGAGQVVWYSHLFQNFPQFVVIHTVKAFGIVNEAEVDVFLEQSCFFDDPIDVGNLISVSSVFSKSSLNIWKFRVHR